MGVTHNYPPPDGWAVLLARRERESSRLFDDPEARAVVWLDWWRRELASGREPSGGYRMVKRRRVEVGGEHDIALRLASFLSDGAKAGTAAHKRALVVARGVMRRAAEREGVACG